MQRGYLASWTVAVALLVATAAADGPPQTITVYGQNDSNVDRQAIQNAIDAAEPGDTVELAGTFQLDGQRVLVRKSRLTITGQAVDDDGDGAVNEDWEDGTDNDGDGWVDEDDWDAVIRGLALADGAPDPGPGDGTLWNYGFVIEGFSHVLHQVTIAHLTFSTLWQPVWIYPEFSYASHQCAEQWPTGGSLKNAAIQRNRFENSARGVTAYGDVQALRVADNRFDGRLGVALNGGLRPCLEVDGTVSWIPDIARPKNTVVAGNSASLAPGWTFFLSQRSDATSVQGNLIEGGNGGIWSTADDQISISKNTVRNANWPIRVAAGSQRAAVLHNEVEGGWGGLVGSDPTSDAQFSNNVVTDAWGFGIWLYRSANGFTALNNQFSNSGFGVDIHLDSSTFENKVIATDFTTTVSDEGIGNTLFGTLAMVDNPGVPDEVRAQLEELREELANRQP